MTGSCNLIHMVGLAELKERYPDVGGKLGENNSWTAEAEQALFEKFWYETKE